MRKWVLMKMAEMAMIATCGDKCGVLVKVTPELVAAYCAEHDYEVKDVFSCGWCANNDNWTIPEMMYNTEQEYLVTPCCHTEAITCLRLENAEDENDQAREDYESYVWAVTGR